MDSHKVTLVFLPLPIRGHLISAVETAKRLLGLRQERAFSVTVLTFRPFVPSTDMAAYMDYAASSGLDIRFQELPLPEGDPLARGDESPEAFISAYVERHRLRVRDAVAQLSLARPVTAMVMDFFCTTLIDVAAELGVPPYVYFTTSASILGLMLYMPALDALVPSDFEEVEGPIHVPGLQSPVPPLTMPGPALRKKERGYTWFLYHARRFREARGIIVNTFSELEPAAVRAHEEGRFLPNHSAADPLVYPIGPNMALEFRAGPKNECLRWLDGQPPASVVFLCFGSGGSFSEAQVKETAVGLERSGHRFLWVLRRPPKHGPGLPTDSENLEQVLPEGFLERTAGRGLVWPSWAPQVDVLAHPSTGGFVTHCGWNSILESLWFGVPMLPWPLYAEQHFNAFQMAGDLGVAVQLEVDRKNGNFVAAEEVERGVRCLMEEEFCEQGRKVRARAREMKEASGRALEDGGSSSESLDRLADQLVRGAGR